MKNLRKKVKRLAALGLAISSISGVAVTAVATPLQANADTTTDSTNLTHQQFLALVGPKAQKIAAAHGMYASVMIAQAILESKWGQSDLASAPNYNLFGIKGAFNGQSVNMSTSEYSGPTEYTTNANFRKYTSYDDSLNDNANLISGNSYYSGALKQNAKTYQDATQALQDKYATSPTYAQALDDVIASNNLTQYDDPNNTTVSSSATTVTPVQPDYKIRTETHTEDVTYKTVDNDTLWGVAQQFNVSIAQLHKWNPDLTTKGDLDSNRDLKVGENQVSVQVPYKTITQTNDIKYTVQNGDSLWKIAQEKNVPVDQIQKYNNLSSDDTMIHVGDQVKIGQETKTFDQDLTAAEKAQADQDAANKTAALQAQANAQAAAQGTTTVNAGTLSQTDTTVTTTSGQTINFNLTGVSQTNEAAVKAIINSAAQQIGKPYVWGGKGPDSFDCSGLTQYVFKQALNKDIGSYTGPQESSGTKISVADAKAGDLLFWGNQGSTYHVAIYLGNGTFIAASHTGSNVEVEHISQYFAPSFAVRVVQ